MKINLIGSRLLTAAIAALVISSAAAEDGSVKSHDEAEVEKSTPQILSMVDFNQGHRYADFDSSTDKVATYGIAALVAGGVAAKMGLFKMLWIFLLGAKKLIILAFVVIGSWFNKLFKKREVT